MFICNYGIILTNGNKKYIIHMENNGYYRSICVENQDGEKMEIPEEYLFDIIDDIWEKFT